MILPCPACMARFMVPDARITRKGVKIRCPKCRFVFIMKAGTDKKKKPAAADDRPAATAGAIGGSTAAAGAIGGAPAAAGAIGEPEAAAKPKKERRAPEEGVAENLSADELAALEEEEIVDMDDLAQATEQSGTAVKADPKLEHLLPQRTGGPSVVLDDSLLEAAAAYTAALGDDVRPAHATADTLMDITADEDLDATPPARPAPLALQSTPPPAPTPEPAPAGDVPPPAPTPYDAAEAAEGEAADAAASDLPPPAPTPYDAAEASADLAPMSEPATITEPGFAIDLVEDEDGVITGAEAADDAVVSMPQTFTMTALAPEYEDLYELEGLLVEEKRALAKGPAAKIIAIIGIVLGVVVLSLLGTLLYARLNPPKKTKPSWGNLQLSNLKHDLIERKGLSWIVKVEVHAQNASKLAKYRNVTVMAQIVDPSGQAKCSNHSPCGLRLGRKDLADVTAKTYHKVLKIKAKSQAYNVQLNPGQGEKCQVLLFCGKRYRIGTDKIKVAIDKERSERVTD